MDLNKGSQAQEPKKEYVKTHDYFAFSIHTNLKAREHTYDPVGVEVKYEDDKLNVYIDGKYAGTGNDTAKKKYLEKCKKNWVINSLAIYENGRARIRIKCDI